MQPHYNVTGWYGKLILQSHATFLLSPCG